MNNGVHNFDIDLLKNSQYLAYKRLFYDESIIFMDRPRLNTLSSANCACQCKSMSQPENTNDPPLLIWDVCRVAGPSLILARTLFARSIALPRPPQPAPAQIGFPGIASLLPIGQTLASPASTWQPDPGQSWTHAVWISNILPSKCISISIWLSTWCVDVLKACICPLAYDLHLLHLTLPQG